MPVVNKAVASLNGVSAAQGALGVVGLAMELENIAAETYIKDTVLAKKTTNKALFASVMGIEAQHVSVLLAVQALLMAGAPQLISLAPGTAAALPAAAGSVGFPHAFYPTNSAAPARARSRQVSNDKTELRGQRARARRHDRRAGRAAPRRRHAAHGANATRAMRRTSRRTFLMGAGAAVAGGAALAAVGAPAMAGVGRRVHAAVWPRRSFPPAGLSGDLAVAAVAASLENLAVFAYAAGLSAATAGKLGAVPPAVATFATTVKGQHQQHADAWNAVLKSHGKAPVTVTNPKLTPVVQADFAKVTDMTGWPGWP